MSDQQQPSVALGNAGQRLERLRRVEAARQRRMLAQQRALLLAPARGGELRGSRGAHLRAEQHLIEDHPEALDREPRGARLLLTPRGQPPLGVGPRSMRLGLGVTE